MVYTDISQPKFKSSQGSNLSYKSDQNNYEDSGAEEYVINSDEEK